MAAMSTIVLQQLPTTADGRAPRLQRRAGSSKSGSTNRSADPAAGRASMLPAIRQGTDRVRVSRRSTWQFHSCARNGKANSESKPIRFLNVSRRALAVRRRPLPDFAIHLFGNRPFRAGSLRLGQAPRFTSARWQARSGAACTNRSSLANSGCQAASSAQR